MLGSVPAELVWFVGPVSEAYDALLYRAMTQELWICAAFGGRQCDSLWYNQRLADRHDTWERAAAALVGPERTSARPPPVPSGEAC